MNIPRILIVDDNPTNLALLLDLMEFEGYATQQAVDAESAQQIVEAWVPDLILMDIGLPGVNGLELTRRLKADPATTAIRIVVVTASAMKGDREKALASGCDAYVTKPIDTRALPAVIARLLGADRNLPAPPAAEPRAAGEEEHLARATSKVGERILIVDDIPANRLLLRAILEPEGFTVVETADGVEALAALRREPFDAVITDVLMPNMDGFRLCMEIRKDPALGRLPLVVYTSTYNSAADRALAEKAGADDYLVKPAPAATVLATLQQAMARAAIRIPGTSAAAPDETEVLKHYNSALIAKLEEKNAELQLAVDTLREREERFRQLAENVNEVFWLTDAGKTTTLYLSPAYEVIWGRSSAEILHSPRGWIDAIHPDDRARIAQVLFPPQPAGSYNEEYRIVRPDGSQRWIHHRAFPVRGPKNEVIRIAGVAEDITERKGSALQIFEQARLLDLARDAITVRGLDDRFTYWNEGATRLYGWQAKEVIGRTVPEILQGLTDEFQAAKMATLQNGVWAGELRHRHRSGARVTVDSRWTLVRDDADQPKAILVINTDVTEKKLIEAQFLRAQRLEAIGMLASGVAHDLNNMLAPIMMAAPLLRIDLASKEREKILDTVEGSVQRGASLVKRLLTFGRGAEGERRLIQPVNILREIERIARDTFPKNIAIVHDFAPDVRGIDGDTTQLHQVLLNLCVNARDAMPDGGTLLLGAANVEIDAIESRMTTGARAGRYVVLRVSDTGSGIPRELQEKIFEPFFTTKESDKGTGLGLSMVTAIVRNHGGFVKLESEVGRGTMFQIFLPASTQTEAGVTAAKVALPPRGSGEMVLLVDDEESIRETVKWTLMQHGYQVLTAADGAQGTALFASRREDIRVVITDLEMPIMDGAMMIHVVLRMKPNVRIIATTGAPSGGSLGKREAQLMAMGIESILNKPYDAETILSAVHRLL